MRHFFSEIRTKQSRNTKTRIPTPEQELFSLSYNLYNPCSDYLYHFQNTLPFYGTTIQARIITTCNAMVHCE